MPEKVWTPLPLVKTTADFLKQKGIPTPRLDAELLLCEALGCGNRVDLYTRFEQPLTEAELGAYRELVKRRAAREPVSRILGAREFMSITFKVTPAVLSPRPETEILVEEALKILSPEKGKKTECQDFAENHAQVDVAEIRDGEVYVEALPPVELESLAEEPGKYAEEPVAPTSTGDEEKTVAAEEVKKLIFDLGTGSGCIAVSLAALYPGVRVVAGDVSEEALAVARENAETAGVAERVEFRCGDCFGVCRPGESFDLIVSNPPYLVEGDPEIWPEVRGFDPALALYGGKDGLDFYKRIASEAETWLNPRGVLLLEIGAGQSGAVMALLHDLTLLENIRCVRDYAGVERVVVAEMPAR
jgi:release factor glutamine methyltransferase